jgi:hypothetical protein
MLVLLKNLSGSLNNALVITRSIGIDCQQSFMKMSSDAAY